MTQWLLHRWGKAVSTGTAHLSMRRGLLNFARCNPRIRLDFKIIRAARDGPLDGRICARCATFAFALDQSAAVTVTESAPAPPIMNQTST